MDCPSGPRLNIEKSSVHINRRGVLRDYVCVRILSYGYGTPSVGSMQSWNSDECSLLTIGKNHEKDLISLLETLKGTTE